MSSYQVCRREAASRETNRAVLCLIKIPLRDRRTDVDFLCMLLLDYHSSSLAPDKSQDTATCLKSHLRPTDIISKTGTHSSNTPQYNQLIGTGWGGTQLAKRPAAPSALSRHLSLLASVPPLYCWPSILWICISNERCDVSCLRHCRSLRSATWTCLFSHQECHSVCHTLYFIHSWVPACLPSLSLLSHFHTAPHPSPAAVAR